MLGVAGPKLAMLALCWPHVGYMLAYLADVGRVLTYVGRMLAYLSVCWPPVAFVLAHVGLCWAYLGLVGNVGLMLALRRPILVASF